MASKRKASKKAKGSSSAKKKTAKTAMKKTVKKVGSSASKKTSKKASAKKTTTKKSSAKKTSSKKSTSKKSSAKKVSAKKAPPKKSGKKAKVAVTKVASKTAKPAKSSKAPKAAQASKASKAAKTSKASKSSKTRAVVSAAAKRAAKAKKSAKASAAKAPAKASKVTAKTTVAVATKTDEKAAVDSRNARLRSQPVAVQEIDVRLDRERSTRLLPYHARSYGKKPRKPHAKELHDQLGKYMGDALSIPEKDMPETIVELGIFCVFSLGAKSHRASLEACKRLVAGFPDWNEFRISEAFEFVEILEDLKIPDLYDRCERVLAFINDVYQDMNEVTLEHLRELSADDRMELLSRYKSLGPALAQYLVLAIQGFQGVVFHYSWARVAQRTGLIGRSGSPKRLVASLQKVTPEALQLSLQVNLLELGEENCQSKNPQCRNCCLVMHCVARKV